MLHLAKALEYSTQCIVRQTCQFEYKIPSVGDGHIGLPSVIYNKNSLNIPLVNIVFDRNTSVRCHFGIQWRYSSSFSSILKGLFPNHRIVRTACGAVLVFAFVSRIER